MTDALAKRPQTAVARRELTYELDIGVDEALARFRERVGVPILDEAEAAMPPRFAEHAEIVGDGFVLRRPTLGRSGRVEALGPGVVGTLEATATGARLRLRVEHVSLTRSQKANLVGISVVVAVCLVGAMAQLGLVFVAAAIAGVAWLRSRTARRAAERELLARVQRVFGPVVASEALPPYRR